jgi:hypothetical protein
LGDIQTLEDINITEKYLKHQKKKMQVPELEEKILDYITTLYSAEYIGLIEVYRDETQYKLILGIPSYMTQTGIMCDADSDDEFLDYIYEELRTRNYVRKETYKVTREDE